jgi:DNA-binding SARP family transcriptional activator
MVYDTPLDIRLLGGFTLARGDGRVALPTRKVAALLAVLALRPGESVSRERLCDLLWSRSAPQQSRASLRQALTQLRRTLADGSVDPLETAGDGVSLRPGPANVDADRLQLALAEDTPESLALAVQLYRGDLLDGFALSEGPFEEWRGFEAERLRRITLKALARHLNRLVEALDVEAALDLGERLLELEPAGEEIHQALIRLDIGRCAPGSAVRRYDRLRSILAETLAVAPSPASRALIASIRNGSRPSATTEPQEGAPPLVAVLPFVDRSPDGGQDHLALGFTEEVVRALARFRSLRILAAQTSFALGGTGTAAGQVAAHFGARYCLAGSVSAAGDTLRIGAQLLDAETDQCLWSERYEGGAAEIYVTQDEISRAVAAVLAVRIDDDLLRGTTGKPLESLASYDCWLRGLAALRGGSRESLEQARPLFERALELDPGFARAYTGLSLTHFNEWSCLAWDRWEENERCAYEYAEQGAGMDPSDHMTQFVLGRILLYRREFERAERHLTRAESLNPNDADMLAHLAFSDACLGEADRGSGRGALARRLNPFHDDWYFAFAAGTALLARRLPEVIEFARRAPHAATDMHACLACAFALQGKAAEARHHRDAFLALYQRRICAGAGAGPDAAVRWLLQVNPVRRAQDRDFLLDGLDRAGLSLKSGLRAHRRI